MQEFILFEPPLILYPLSPFRANVAQALLGGGGPGDGGEVLGPPPLKSTPRALGLAAGETG